MKQRSRRVTPDRLSELRRRFERWRKSRRPGTRIPEDLWQGAAKVGRELGVSKTAQELHLDYYALRRRAESATEERSTPRPPSERGFLEIPLCAPTRSECVLEIEDGQGARLRVALQGPAPADLETLARTLWSLAR